MKTYATKIATLAMPLIMAAVFLLAFGGTANAVDNVPPVNLNQAPTTAGSPFGAFKILQCDGPAGLNTAIAHQVKDVNGRWIVDPAWKQGKNADGSDFVPCDFRGLMIQTQFVINAAIIIGVLAAMIGFAYAGFLYITGTQANLKKAHAIFPKVFWGFIIMLTAWSIVYQILKWLTPGGTAYLQG